MLATLKQYPSSVTLLLSASLLLSLGRAITLPYLVVYLSSGFNIGINDIGLMLGGSLIIGSLLSVYGGHLTDKFCSYPLILSFTIFFIAGFVGMCATSNMWLFFCFLAAFNFAYSAIDVVVKATFGRLLPINEQSRVFSIRYTLINVGHAVGPFLGAGLAHISLKLPFFVSASLGIIFFLAYGLYGERRLNPEKTASAPLSFTTVGRVLLRDRRLVCFTFGGTLSAVVIGQYTAYLSQYLVITNTAEFTYQVISAIVAVNAVTVIALQYPIGKRISINHLNLWLMAGLSLFLVGVAGFAMASSVLQWSLAMLIFTIGEIIVFPTEYMFIDRIAPSELRGIYYGAQNLSNLGGAVGPILCGYILINHPAQWVFYMLAICIIAGGCFYLSGTSIRVGQDKNINNDTTKLGT